MTGRRQRGRPKKPLPASPLGPAPFGMREPEKSTPFSKMLKAIDAAEADLIGSVRKSRPTLTNQHALGLALENQLGDNERASLLEADAALRSHAKKYVEKGGKETGSARTRTRENRIKDVGRKNHDLIAKVKPNGHLSIARAADILLSNWTTTGDGGKRPSLTTARRWLKILSTSS